MYDNSISNTNLCVYHLGEVQKESNNLSLLKNLKDVTYYLFQWNTCKNKDFFIFKPVSAAI